MSIQNIHTGSHRPDPLQHASNNRGANEVHGGTSAEQEEGTPGVSDTQDRVEISDAARTALAEEQGKTPEINFARKALLGIPPLSQDRIEDILKRVQEGYYSQPEVVKQTAEQVEVDLSGRTEADLPSRLPG